MATKATLKVVLMADKTTVAESDDPVLWQRVLVAINGSTSKNLTAEQPAEIEGEPDPVMAAAAPPGASSTAVARFAKSIGATVGEVVGALSPALETPYLRLDRHCWAAMKKATASRGPGAFSSTGLAGTFLYLWLKQAQLDIPATQGLALQVLDTIDVKDKNSSRGIKNTRWLQARPGGAIVVNAAEIARAQQIARSFCKKEWAGSGSAA